MAGGGRGQEGLARMALPHVVEDALVGGDDEGVGIEPAGGGDQLRRGADHIGLRGDAGRRFGMDQDGRLRMLARQRGQFVGLELVMHHAGALHSSMSAPVRAWMWRPGGGRGPQDFAAGVQVRHDVLSYRGRHDPSARAFTAALVLARPPRCGRDGRRNSGRTRRRDSPGPASRWPRRPASAPRRAHAAGGAAGRRPGAAGRGFAAGTRASDAAGAGGSRVIERDGLDGHDCLRCRNGFGKIILILSIKKAPESDARFRRFQTGIMPGRHRDGAGAGNGVAWCGPKMGGSRGRRPLHGRPASARRASATTIIPL